ncbi:hypothetical protein [Clostridium tyrobutyricum]|uniref:hypothetical protein n=1 Tax=Clostridium tyrobutyricum TaxID=1519 RepID=UPI0030CD4842
MFQSEDEQNKFLLYKYLQQVGFDEITAENMILQHSSNLFGYHGLCWQLGRMSLEFFCMYFLQDTFLPKDDNAARKLAPVHYETWNILEDMILRDKFDKLELIMPRGCAKTTVCDFGLSVWQHCYRFSVYTLVAGRTEQDSTEFISQIRRTFEENQYIISAFGKLINDKKFTVNKLEIELTNHTKIQAISSTTSMRGKKYNNFRPTCIIADDYQGKNDIITPEARDKKYNTWIEDSGYAGDKAVYRNGKKIKKATKFIVLGTILHRDCFMSRLLNNRDYKHVVKRVCDFDVDEYFHSGLWDEFRKNYFNNKLQDPESAAKEFYYQYEKDMQYKTIWPDKYGCLDTAIDYFNNPTAFKQEMMNDASKIGEKWFKSIRTESPEDIEEHNFVKTMLTADPASSTGKKSDFTAMCVGSEADNDFRYIRKGVLIKVGFDDFCLKIISFLKKYPDITHVDIEKNLYMGADVSKIRELIATDPELANRNIEFINNMQRKNKDSKISTIIDAVNNGQIIFNSEDKEPIQQILDFCGQDFSLHDDFPDCVSQFDIDVKNIEVIHNVQLFDRRKLGL